MGIISDSTEIFKERSKENTRDTTKVKADFACKAFSKVSVPMLQKEVLSSDFLVDVGHKVAVG